MGVVAPVGVVLSRIEASLLFKFTVAKSGLPSPLMSPMLTEWVPVPVAKVTWGAKLGVVAPVGVVLSRIEALLSLKFAVAKSGLPSPLISPMLMELGKLPVAKVTWEAKVGMVAPVVVVLSRMEAVLLLMLATAKSGLPSPLKSPMLTDSGLRSVAKVTWVAKVGVVALVGVVLSRIETVLLLKFVTAKSGLLSPLMSLMPTDSGKLPCGKVTWVAKVGVVALVGVVLSRMEMLLLLRFVTTKSGLPSLLMSLILTE